MRISLRLFAAGGSHMQVPYDDLNPRFCLHDRRINILFIAIDYKFC